MSLFANKLPKLTRSQENVLYKKLRLIKGQTVNQLKCQKGTVKALTSSGFALEKEANSYSYKKTSIYFLNQCLDITPIIFHKEELLKIWMDTDPSARSPYQLYGCPPMWKTIELPDGLALFTRMSKQIAKPNTQDLTSGISYQFQLDGEWIGQGHFCEYTDFENTIAPALQSDLDYLRRIAN